MTDVRAILLHNPDAEGEMDETPVMLSVDFTDIDCISLWARERFKEGNPGLELTASQAHALAAALEAAAEEAQP